MKTKFFNVVAAATMLLLSAPAGHAQSLAYSNAIASFNPVGYWPMHEVEAPAAGDIETNYGTLGLLGTGFYPDWATTANGLGIKRGVPGALANDPDTAVYFTRAASPAAGTYTNALFVPHTSPLSTLNPPFTVECWFEPTNEANADVWVQAGYTGLNGPGTGTGETNTITGSGPCGIRLTWNGTNTAFQVYNEYNSATLNTEGFSGNTNTPNNTPLNHWYYLVLTCDANTNISLYVNNNEGLYPYGVPGGSYGTVPAVGLYTPDYWTPLTIGSGRGGTRAVGGFIDEFAVYTNVITDIAQHYSDGTSESQAGVYFDAVTNDNPVIYLRMDAPAIYTPGSPLPTMTNYGSVAVNGVYTPGTMPGIVSGPVNSGGVPFQGLSGTNAAQLSGVSSFGDAGNAAAYNPTGPAAPFTVTALFRGNPCDNRIQTIVGHSANSWAINITTSGTLQCQLGTNTTSLATSTGVYNDGNWHQVVEVYTTNSTTGSPGTNALYVDGVLDGLSTNVTPNGVGPGTNLDVMIGADPQYTNNPPGVGRQFAGQICEVAFFTNSLTFSQIQTLYSNCEVAPFIKVQPVSASAAVGAVLTNTVTAGGSPALSYQWFTNGVAFGGQTSASLILNPVVAADASTNYYVVVTNYFGSVTSTPVSLTVYGPPVFTSELPVTYTNVLNTNFLTLYAGANPTFSVSAIGAQPIYYQWFTNGVATGPAATNNASFTFTNVQIGSVKNYCIATNFVGPTTGEVWTASVIADPTNNSNGLAPYPTNVLADNPIGYWRLNEGNDNGNGDDGYLALDYAGGNDGIYTNVILGQTGYSPTTDPSDTSPYFGEYGSLPAINEDAGQIQGIDFAATNSVNGEFTVEAWANGINSGSFPQVEGAPLATKGLYGVNDEFNLGIDSTKLHYRLYVRSASGTQYTVGSGSSPALDNGWQHVVGVCDEANGQLLLYVNGILANTAAIPTNSGVYEASNSMSIGAGTSDGVNYTNQFIGNINDVAVYNHALSMGQIQAQYSSVEGGGIPPYFVQTPQATITVDAGTNLTFPALAGGTTPLGYYWTDVNAGTNVAASVTNGLPLNATLTVSNVPSGWNNDQLKLTVTNAYGTTNFIVTLAVLGKPVIVNDLPLQIILLSGSYTYSIGIIGVPPYSYQWYNGTPPGGTLLVNQTNSTYTATVGSPGTSATYYVVITNVFGATTSSVSTFKTATQLTNAYGANLLRFKPVGYWPMHETEFAAHGDIETNYGSLGALGTGYYGDWASPWASPQASGIIRDFPGALPGDTDPAVDFIYTGAANTGSPTNCLFIPHTSPLTTLNPPYTVECWFYPTTSQAGDIWAQEGASALNGNGGGNWAGTRLYWNPGFRIYTFDNNGSSQNGLGLASDTALNTWYHLVVTCDVNTNQLLYVNGSLATSKAAVGLYTPDYWSPLTIGVGRGFTRGVSGGIDELAVYATNLLAADIAQHYTDGTSGSAGAYKADVLMDNPLIYLRMDSLAYSPPGGNWPALDNYGSAPVNGLYSPGVIPGGISGPTNAAGFVATNAMPDNGVSSYADAGYDPSFNPTGSSQTLSVTAWFKGNPADSRLQTLIGHSDASWRMDLTATGNLQFGVGSDTILNSTGIYNDGNWHQFVGVYDGVGLNEYIYVDGALDSSTAITGSAIAGSTADVFIGSDPQYTNNPAGQGQQFSGNICEAAFFTNTLTAAQVQQIYTATAPSVNTNPTNILFSVSNNALTLSWPADHIGWQLQAQTNSVLKGLSTNWVNFNPSTGTNRVVIPVNLTNGTVFYRLTY